MECLTSLNISRDSSGESSSIRAACLMGDTIRWPGLYGYLLSITAETAPRNSRCWSSESFLAASQKTHLPSLSSLPGDCTYSLRQGAHSCFISGLVYPFPDFLACLEKRHLLRLYGYVLPCLGVSSLARLAFFYLEASKPPYLDL